MSRRIIIRSGEAGQGRSFEAQVLAYVDAAVWSNARSDRIRPVYAMLGMREGDAAPVVANLRMGREASYDDGSKSTAKDWPTFEFLKSANYTFVPAQKHEIGHRPGRDGAPVPISGYVVQVYLPDLVRVDPGTVDPEAIRFCVVPTREQFASSTIDIGPAVDHLRARGFLKGDGDHYRDEKFTEGEIAALAPLAPIFAAYLNRRTYKPLPVDPCFFLQLLVACLYRGIACRSSTAYRSTYHEVGLADVGLMPGVAFYSGHEVFDKLLAQQVALYFGRARAVSDDELG